MKPEALILAGLDLKGYGIMRSLGREGVPVVGITNQKHDPGRFSRYCKRCYSYSNLADDQALCRLLLEWRSDFDGNPVLFTTFDHFVLLLAKYREALSPHYEYHWLPLETLMKIISKDQMSILCRRAGILIPRTHTTDPEEDLRKSVRDFSFPCLIKPVRKYLPDFPVGKKNVVVNSPGDLIDFYSCRPALKGMTIWQEIIEGGDANHFVCAMVVRGSGEPAGVFCTRKLHQYPPSYGSMCYGRSEQNDAVIAEALKLVRFLGYRGIASLEFKYQPKDDRYYFIEMNTRCPLYNAYFANAGVNLQYLAYLDLTGIADDRAFRARQRNGVYWINVHDDLKWYRETRKGHRPSLWQWLRYAARVDSYAFWNWRDPKPFLVSSLQTLSVGIGRLLKVSRDFLTKRGKAA